MICVDAACAIFVGIVMFLPMVCAMFIVFSERKLLDNAARSVDENYKLQDKIVELKDEVAVLRTDLTVSELNLQNQVKSNKALYDLIYEESKKTKK